MAPNAAKPYDSAALADLILRSSDRVDFYVLGALLRYVSSTFRTMLESSNVQAIETEKKDNYPVITVAEDSNTLRLLLDSIYPASQEPWLFDVGPFWKAAKASQKYCMKIVEEKLRKRILESHLLGLHPLHIYAVATDLGWDEVTIAAARGTLRIPLSDLSLYVVDLKRITGADFYRFLEYRLRCNKSSNSTVEKLMVMPGVAPIDTTSEPISPKNTSAPFDSSAPADLILRSSDSVDFFVLGGLVRRLSPVLSDILSLPDNKGPMPIVPVKENSKVLRCLLSVIYHDLDEPDLNASQLYINVVLAARGYKMTAIERRLCKQAAHSPLVVSDPLRVYVVASVLGWNELARTTALNTFREPLDKMPYLDEFRLIDGADLYRLVRFRFSCADAACSALQNDTIFPNNGLNNFKFNFRINNSGWNSDTVRAGQSKFASISHDKTDPVISQLKDCPRGSTVSDMYSKKLRLAITETDKFEKVPPFFFNTVQCTLDAEKLVESAVAKVAWV